MDIWIVKDRIRSILCTFPVWAIKNDPKNGYNNYFTFGLSGPLLVSVTFLVFICGFKLPLGFFKGPKILGGATDSFLIGSIVVLIRVSPSSKFIGMGARISLCTGS